MEVEDDAKTAADRLVDRQRYVTGSEKATNEALRQLADMLKRVGLLEGEALVSKLQLSKIGEAGDPAISGSDGRLRKVGALEALVRMLCDELGSHKYFESTNCDVEVITHKVAEAQEDTINLVTRLHRSNASSYHFIRRNVHGTLVEVSNRSKKVINCDACSLQQGVYDAVRAATESAQSPFAGAPGSVNKSLELFIGRATGEGESARSDTFLSRTTDRDASAYASSSRVVVHCQPLFRLLLQCLICPRRMILVIVWGVVYIVTVVVVKYHRSLVRNV